MSDFKLEVRGLIVKSLKPNIDLIKYNIIINTLIFGEEFDDIEFFDFDQSSIEWQYFDVDKSKEFSGRGIIVVELEDGEEESISTLKTGVRAYCAAEFEFTLDGDSAPLVKGVDYDVEEPGSWAIYV